MNQQAVKQTIREDVESMAELLVMADLSDSSTLEVLNNTFAGLSGVLETHFPLCSRASLAVVDILGNSVDKGIIPDSQEMQTIEKTISALQVLVAREIDEKVLDLPKVLGSYLAPDETAIEIMDGESNSPTDFAVGVDQDILEEYLVHQETVIAEIEELVLAYEQNPDQNILKAFKRYLHTAKGEAGVIGLNLVERVCHHVEDYIQEGEGEQDTESLQVDPLLEFKDWFEQTIIAIKNQMPLPSADNLLNSLKQDEVIASAPAAQLTAEPSKELSELDTLLDPVIIEDPEITADFVSETQEHFEISDENLLTLENDPENEEAIASIFRAFHTIKGTTSFLGLVPISRLAHVAETLLDEVRKKRLDFKGVVVDATFNAFDLLKKMTKELERALGAGEMFIPDPELPEVFLQLKNALESHDVSDSYEPKEKTAAAKLQVSMDTDPEIENIQINSGSGQTHAGRSVKQTMKIDADRIDLLLETIGELVIMESIVNQEASLREGGESRVLERNLAQLTKITRSLQDMGMSMRLIPIDNTFRKMGRLVRDLAKKSEKKIELVMEGKETELDKGMVEKLGDPLVHMIRNAVDHGIEATAEDRIAAGKKPAGRIILKAYHQGGGIHIEIRDDGKGLDKDVIVSKAIERGLISSADNMSEEEIYALIFEPGFSTAKQITDVSGRGVGMDVVRSNIESMRGNVRISSEKGKGSIFTLVLPLTMAIIDGMIVRVGSERYILPLLSIIESFQPTPTMISKISGKGEVVPFRNRLLPMFRLSTLFEITDAQEDPEKALVVVIEDAGKQVALLVDELLGQNQTVIKNLGEGVRAVEGIAGASIMPDGTPGLIIDVNGLVKLATA